jgi:hypothetical protein
MKKIFYDLYKENSASQGIRPIRTEDGKIYIKHSFPADESRIISKNSVVEVSIRDENILKNSKDVFEYRKLIEKDICTDILKIKFNPDFVVPTRLLNFLAKQSIKDEIKVDNHYLLHAIDLASAGGALVAKKGTYEGKYYLYDIANSYNKFFIDYKIPSNPKFASVEKIYKSSFFLYRLKISDENFSKEKKWKLRTNRTWFTKWDIDLFDMFGVKYELINGKNNCVKFVDKIDTDFEWMETLNEEKQKTDGEEEPMKKMVLKNLLSSFWGNMCKYNCITEKEYGEEIPDNYFHKVGVVSGDDLYIHPEKFYLYSIAICKPFVLAYARYRLLKQIHEIEEKGYEVIYAHTDSIITDCPKKYFDIGSDIGQWKLEKKSKNKVVINNIANKIFD